MTTVTELRPLPTSPIDALTAIFDQLCYDLGLDPFSNLPRYVVVIPPRQRVAETSSFRLVEPTGKGEPIDLTPAYPPGNVLGVGNADNERGPDTGPDPTTEEDPMLYTADTATAVLNTALEAGVTLTVSVRGRKGVSLAETVTGTPVSINSKGLNLKVDGKVRSFAIARIDELTANVPVVEVEAPTVEDTPEITDGMSTRDVADLFDIEAKELRVHLRKLGRGVGKGRKYGLTIEDVNAVRAHLATVNAEAPADGDNA